MGNNYYYKKINYVIKFSIQSLAGLLVVMKCIAEVQKIKTQNEYKHNEYNSDEMSR